MEAKTNATPTSKLSGATSSPEDKMNLPFLVHSWIPPLPARTAAQVLRAQTWQRKAPDSCQLYFFPRLPWGLAGKYTLSREWIRNRRPKVWYRWVFGLRCEKKGTNVLMPKFQDNNWTYQCFSSQKLPINHWVPKGGVLFRCVGRVHPCSMYYYKVESV